MKGTVEVVVIVRSYDRRKDLRRLTAMSQNMSFRNANPMTSKS